MTSEEPNNIDRIENQLNFITDQHARITQDLAKVRSEINQLKSGAKDQVDDSTLESQEPVIESPQTSTSKKLYRNRSEKIISGVCSGLADYFGVKPIIIRLIFLVLLFFYGIGILAYVIAMVLIPAQPFNYQRKAESPVIRKPAGEYQTQADLGNIQNDGKSEPKFVSPTLGQTSQPIQVKSAKRSESKTSFDKSNLEKFIGENLLNKIGIAITVIGAAIGAKYTIEHDLISPLTRIILGYLLGGALLAIGIKLKSKYESYSAVLVGGAIAIMYFITYIAYSSYALLPQSAAFIMMFAFTAFGVLASLKYNQQVIAHIGLVGAYAVPFLLSDGSGNALVLLSYVSIINLGILVISVKKDWRALYYAAFGLSWLIFAAWYFNSYQIEEHFTLALVFAGVFFITFYSTFLNYKIFKKESFEQTDILVILANSFVFFGFGYAILDGHVRGSELLGLFTLLNAFVHTGISILVFKMKLADKKLFHLLVVLSLTFVTLAIPVELNGHWVTLIWAIQAALLFWIGRTKQTPFYEYISYPLMLLAVGSIIQDWSIQYYESMHADVVESFVPVFNINFLTSAVFILSFGLINLINSNSKFVNPMESKAELKQFASLLLSGVFLGITYMAFRMEIDFYWNELFEGSKFLTSDEFYDQEYYESNYSLKHFKSIWLVNYTLIFMAVLSVIASLKKRKESSITLLSVLNFISLVYFLTVGLYEISELRENYLNSDIEEYFMVDQSFLYIRYISLAFVAVFFISANRLIKKLKNLDYYKVFNSILAISILWILSSELLSLMDIYSNRDSYKLGLSILWGTYSLIFIIIGIWKKQSYFRIGAIVLFGITLVKLFFYDIAYLDTISKTVVFLSLGVLLLIISFLYNKFKAKISDENQD